MHCKLKQALLVLVVCLLDLRLTVAADEDAWQEPWMSTGANLKIELVKRNSSELATTTLTEPNIASFGGSIPAAPEKGLMGELVPFSPLDACAPLESSPLFNQIGVDGKVEFRSLVNSTDFVVLVQKGSCSFLQMIERISKIPHVGGILVFDPTGSTGLTTSLQLKSDSGSFVPTFLISNALGNDLMKKVNKYRMFANGTSTEDAPWIRIKMSYQPVAVNLAKSFQIFLILLVVALLLCLIGSMVINFSSDDIDTGRDTPDPPPRRRPEEIPIDEEFIKKIPTRYFRSLNSSPIELGKNVDEDHDYRQHQPHNDTCPICLEDFVYGSELNQLHCGHCYHPKCIVPWLKERSPVCPLCKIDVRVSMIESEELAYVRQLRRQRDSQRNRSFAESPVTPDCEMKEVCVVSDIPENSRIRTASFDSIPLEAAPLNSTNRNNTT